MLQEISIKILQLLRNYLSLKWNDDFNWETGAGKSIIIDAMSLLLGGRASSDFGGHGANKAEIEGLFFLIKLRIEGGIIRTWL
ncbi:MAG: hypothetical protein ACLT64_07715 [Streptococcus salivarius]